MLPSGPRYTYPIPSMPQFGARELAKQILESIRQENANASEIRTGTMTIGCDGLPKINPLDGTTCNGGAGDGGVVGGQKILFNPQTRTVLSTLGNIAKGVTSSFTLAGCDNVLARLRAKRRFIDNLGTMYGPDGAYLSPGNPAAHLETDYVHEVVRWHATDIRFDPPRAFLVSRSPALRKLSGTPASLALPGIAQGTVWPSVNDLVLTEIRRTEDNSDVSAVFVTQPLSVVTGLDDAVFGGTFTGSADTLFTVTITGVGSPDVFKIQVTGLTDVTGVSITGGGAPQNIGLGITIAFDSQTGHTLNDKWIANVFPGNDIIRQGVAVRGTIHAGNPCLVPNDTLLLTTEMNTAYNTFYTGTTYGGRAYYYYRPEATGSHALVVRNADTLELLYRKALAHDGTGYPWGDPPEKFCFSTNAEGLFFMHCYTTPVLASPPSPYPGAEFGAPNPRKIAVISINPITFEPTIQELITLGGSSGGSFAVATTLGS